MSLFPNIQEAIDTAVKENRRIETISPLSNEDIRLSITDYKNCAVMKKNEKSKKIIIYPPSDFGV